MTPGARIQATVTLLASIEAGDEPADAVIGHWARGNRYAGSGDRREIRRLVYGVVRRRRQLEWWLERNDAAATPRGLVIAFLLRVDDWTMEQLTAAFAGIQYGPEPMTPDEARIAESLAGGAIDDGAQPQPVRLNLPDWLAPLLAESFGSEFEAEAVALAGEAAVDLRVNTLKATRALAMEALAADGLDAQTTPYAPDGLRLDRRAQLTAARAWRDGLVEVQDEGSQLVALLTDARPGQSVVDFCAGAGGKALALAAAMENRGRIVACDLSESRLRRLRPRLRRAGVDIIEAQVLAEADDPWVAASEGGFERVLVDAPCSGTGAWRRRPETKWQLTSATLDALCALQDRILDSAARLVAPSGRLIYATCSVLRLENQARVETFLARHPDFSAVAADGLMPEQCRDPALFDAGNLYLTPYRHGTDGFFAAVFERAP